jgi:hypothetical protein
MTTLTGTTTRTLVGYVVTLLDYPRWIIERDVDFTDCHLSGGFDAEDTICSSCRFGTACCWLNANRGAPSPSVPLDELLRALQTSVEFLRKNVSEQQQHVRECRCDTCQWLHEAMIFLRQHRHRS